MTWLLILHLSLPGQSPQDMAFAVTVDERACAIAGAGSAMILTEANPGLQVTWTCLKQGESA